jgi:hypothetical protein
MQMPQMAIVVFMVRLMAPRRRFRQAPDREMRQAARECYDIAARAAPFRCILRLN